MKKKVLSAILSVAMVASLIVGCGAKEEAAAPAATEEAAPAATEEAAPAAEAEEAAPAADGELIKVGFAQVGHESD